MICDTVNDWGSLSLMYLLLFQDKKEEGQPPPNHFLVKIMLKFLFVQNRVNRNFIFEKSILKGAVEGKRCKKERGENIC